MQCAVTIGIEIGIAELQDDNKNLYCVIDIAREVWEKVLEDVKKRMDEIYLSLIHLALISGVVDIIWFHYNQHSSLSKNHRDSKQ